MIQNDRYCQNIKKHSSRQPVQNKFEIWQQLIANSDLSASYCVGTNKSQRYHYVTCYTNCPNSWFLFSLSISRVALFCEKSVLRIVLFLLPPKIFRHQQFSIFGILLLFFKLFLELFYAAWFRFHYKRHDFLRLLRVYLDGGWSLSLVGLLSDIYYFYMF